MEWGAYLLEDKGAESSLLGHYVTFKLSRILAGGVTLENMGSRGAWVT